MLWQVLQRAYIRDDLKVLSENYFHKLCKAFVSKLKVAVDERTELTPALIDGYVASEWFSQSSLPFCISLKYFEERFLKKRGKWLSNKDMNLENQTVCLFEPRLKVSIFLFPSFEWNLSTQGQHCWRSQDIAATCLQMLLESPSEQSGMLFEERR